jgi:hypothetical protein
VATYTIDAVRLVTASRYRRHDHVDSVKLSNDELLSRAERREAAGARCPDRRRVLRVRVAEARGAERVVATDSEHTLPG